MRIAYSVNQYPAVTHSFVRREILEFERSGVDMVRLGLPRWAGTIAEILKRQEVHQVHARFGTISAESLNATALVLPSLAERLPVAIMEAMALRRPALSTSIAGIPQLVSASLNGWLVRSGVTEALAAAMESCLSASPADIEKMGNAAQRIVLERHDIGSETRKLAAHFLQVVGERAHALGR